MVFTSQLNLEKASLCEISEGLWQLPGHSDLNYLDGSEERLLQVIRESTDISSTSTELARKCWSRTSEYHLSQKRANLLRPLDLRPNHVVLELGASCGALTRYLGEQGATVVAVERSLPRARIIRERCRDLPNVSVVAGDFQALPQQPVADVVTLIGVLEYSARYLASPQPFLDCIRMASGFAKRGAVVVAAIDNRLGLQYFCGEAGDPYRRAFHGSHNRQDFKRFCTFSRSEIEDLVCAAGLEHLEFLFPFPDFKTPNSVITERGLRAVSLKLPFRPSMLFYPERRQRLKASSNEILSIGQVWRAMESAGCLPYFANSFLVLASKDPDSLHTLARDGLAFYYPANERAQAFLQETRFFEECGEVKVVKKRFCECEPREHPTYIHCFSAEPQIVSGEGIDLPLRKALSEGNLEKVKAVLHRYGTILKELEDGGAAGGDWLERKISGAYWDLNIGNCILRGDGSHYLIDLEWRARSDVRTWEVLYRSLYHVVVNHFLPLAKLMGKRTREDVFRGLIEMVGAPFEEQKLKEMLANEVGFLHFISNDPTPLSGREISRKVAKKLRSFLKKRRVPNGLTGNLIMRIVRQQNMLKGFVDFLARLRQGK